MLTGKVFEYLGSATAILALVPQGEARDLIARTRAGIVVDPDDPRALREVLREAWRRHRSGERRHAEPDAEEIARYTRRALAGRLAGILEEAAGAGPPRRGSTG